MKLDQLIKVLPDAVVDGDLEVDIRKVRSDSRQVEVGDLFVAIKGYQTDGHRFIDQALARGARAVVLENDRRLEGATRIRVPNSRRALATLADRFYGHPSRKLKLVGITGTNGKTTVSHLARKIYESAGISTGLIGTISYHVGSNTLPAIRTTPESIDLHRLLSMMVGSGQKIAVLEVSSHSLALERVHGIRFEVAAFTNISRDHLDFHKSYEDYFAAKRSLFEGLDAASGSRAVINIDDPAAAEIISHTKVPVLTYGFSPEALIRPVHFGLGWQGLDLTLETPAGRFSLQSHLIGRFNIMNILAAVGIALASGIGLEAIREGVEKVQALSGRFEQIDCGQDFRVVVDYAHTPAALETLLLTTRGLPSARIILVFGCGGDRDRGKRPLMGEIASRLADLCFITSDNPRNEDPETIIEDIISGVVKRNYEIAPDRREAIRKALEVAERDDVVVIAGKGHENYQIIGERTVHFDDREVVQELLKGTAHRGPITERVEKY
ncbi:MAG TPA: UDP-N-acetylmuramoyl-L-alanyl-D-glutamate--2,6-diaminopimelate ligase [Candidatus Latescibacteria bacterium]|nr:UDP-N-acetylmuramoyl-L-alanyl-D-glutamate--2,6-diaminopimelate ligase [Candidatus Latescibacterota bacterium]